MRLALLSMSLCCVIQLCSISPCQAEGFFFPRPGKSVKSNNCEESSHCRTANVPPGTRQVCKYGKQWPPQPRSTEPQQSFHQQYHSAHYWPYPYNLQDQAIVTDLVQSQTINGWRDATTLHNHHFNIENNELNSSGKEHLTWIITSTPAEYRQVFVAAATEGYMNDARMNSVHATMAYYTGNDQSIPVSLRIASIRGRPAYEVEIYQKAARDGAIPPVIQYNSVQSSGGGS